MKKRRAVDEALYYERHGVLGELRGEAVEFSLSGELATAIRSETRKRRLRNISIKLDAIQIQALKKISVMRSMPYQTLIRHWLSECIGRELRLKSRSA